MQTRALSIGFVTVADLPEGSGRTGRLRALVGALVGMGHRVTIWNQHGLGLPGVGRVSGELGGARFEYVLGKTERSHGFRAASLKLQAVTQVMRRVREAARRRELDLIVFNNLAFYDTYPITRLARRLGIPTIQCYEDERLEVVMASKLGLARRIFGWNSWLADRWCSRMADQLWVISSYLKEKYARLSRHPERVRIIPTIVDCEAWKVPPEPETPMPVILYSGSFGEQEDIAKTTEALGVLRRQNIPFRMRFLGADPQLPGVPVLRTLVKSLGLEDCVDIKGFCVAEVVKQEVAQASILVNLRTNSIWSQSGLSTKLSEYLAAGRTVLTTDIGDNARYVENGKSAIVVSVDDSAERVAAILKEPLQDPALRRRLGEGARQAALRHFDVPVVQRKMREALGELRMPRAAVAG